ncbi:MAG: hypothetical protein V1799_22125 [bacterium]
MQTTLLNDTLEKIDKLSISEQEELLDIVKRRLIERRRREIARNAKALRKSFLNGTATLGSISQLREELEP